MQHEERFRSTPAPSSSNDPRPQSIQFTHFISLQAEHTPERRLRRVDVKPLPLDQLAKGESSENELSSRSQSQTLETLRKLESFLVSSFLELFFTQFVETTR